MKLSCFLLKDIVIIGMFFNVSGVLNKSDFWYLFENGEYGIWEYFVLRVKDVIDYLWFIKSECNEK